MEFAVNKRFPDKSKLLAQFFKELPFKSVNTPKTIDFDYIPNMRDAKDIPILAAAIDENVDVFITGDKDFLVLNIEKPKIVTMTQFLDKNDE